MKVFIPQQISHHKSNTLDLIGYYSPSRHWMCFVDTYNSKNPYKLTSKSHQSDLEPVFGQIRPKLSLQNGKNLRNFVSIIVDDSGRKSVENVILDSKALSGDVTQRCVLVEFKMEHLMKSLYFKDKMFHNDITDFLLASCNCEADSSLQLLQTSTKIENKTTVLYLCIFMTTITSFFSKLWTFRVRLFEQFCSPPAVLEQLKRKHQDCDILCQQVISDPQGSYILKVKNMLVRNLLDMALGLALMWLFTAIPENTIIVSNSLTELGQRTAQELQVLLHWMMGVPAGLKLNSQLDQFLGKFFLYHIYLWKAYLNVLRPLLPSVLWYTSLSGCLGLSVQLALLQDLFSMMTLHIYCFYVYAARLYSFQMSGLSSLWRLFRGRKWNSLRRRVDTTQYDTNQLFVGTLLFTVLLFLLPTTALYYVIFLALRVLVLVIQGSVYTLISVINNSPLYFVLVRLFSSHTVANTLEFVVSKSKEQEPLCMEMKFKAAGYSHLVREGQMAGVSRDPGSWGKLFKHVITGRLIYPWIDKPEASDKN